MAVEKKISRDADVVKKERLQQSKDQSLDIEIQPLNYVTIQEARIDPRMLKPDDIPRLQHKIGNRKIDRLLRPIHEQINNTLQRVKMYPFDAEGNQLGNVPITVDLSTATYKQLIEYKKIWNEKQLERSAHPQCEINNEEAIELARLITQKEAIEAEVPQVICPEGEVKVARPRQAVQFGAITSCMAISLVLSDNTVISAHNGQTAQIPGGGIPQLKQIAAERSNQARPSRVIAIGAGDYWDTNLGRVVSEYSGGRVVKVSGGTPVSENEEEFKRYLSAQLGAPAEFHQHDVGLAGISSAELREYIGG